MKVSIYFLAAALTGILLIFYFFQEDIQPLPGHEDTLADEGGHVAALPLIGTVGSIEEDSIYLDTGRGYVWVTVPQDVADIYSFQAGDRLEIGFDVLYESDPASTTATKIDRVND
ncbi:hypothetical protein P6709_06225 [Jeotgalibacillus sp. ET6]|uniref:hypothetical protein n=1 Tax=Jeotgalibacillus sp. ET6 TaxID=3037260 RepID=UPI0024187BAF|nr:hypothetical protein [Jeotgalibacillus sp. ET6]MDG5471336.1 hypothetical protein [Jeotgalibacillus sp. ET6]